jgi:hypothetical protein
MLLYKSLWSVVRLSGWSLHDAVLLDGPRSFQ